MKGISCIVPAAGFSRRSAAGNKLLAPLPNGTPVVRQVVSTLLEAGLKQLVVVTGHQSALVEQALHGLGVSCVYASLHGEGMGASLAAGVRASSLESTAFLVCPADLPWLQASTVEDVCRTYFQLGGLKHIIPVQGGIRGHPVILGGWLRSSLEALAGEEGARRLLVSGDERPRCHELCVSDKGIHRDVDGGLSLDEFRSP